MLEIAYAGTGRYPWFASVDSGIALLASVLPDGHDAGFKSSKQLLNKLQMHIHRVFSGAETPSSDILAKAIRRAFDEVGPTNGYGLHLGVIVSTRRVWYISTAGLICSAIWTGKYLATATEPQSIARELLSRGEINIPSIAMDIAKNVVHTGAPAFNFEWVEAPRLPGQGVGLFASAALLESIRELTAKNEGHIRETLAGLVGERQTDAPVPSFAMLLD
jgi:hypothetical protein